jgi:hypothetical protein
MLQKRSLFFIVTILIAFTAVGQDKKEKASSKSDNPDFYRKIIALKEYKAELKKVEKLSKEQHSTTTVKIDIDNTTADDEDNKQSADTLTGYIQEVSGDVSVVAYEILFDRKTKKIVAVKDELDGMEISTESVKDSKDEKE